MHVNKNLIKTRALLLKNLREFFDKEGFIEVIPPVLVGATGACENVSTVFSLDYFGKKAFLAQTTQLFLEWYIYNGIDRVYSVNKSFRAEPRITTRHQTEFTLVEFEAKDWNLDDLINFECRLLDHIKGEFVNVDRIIYDGAIYELKKAGLNVEWGDDLSSEAEQILTQNHGVTIVTHYPAKIKFFNMKLFPDTEIVDCCDLLLPGVGEAIGGSVRESDYSTLVKRLSESDMLKHLIEAGGRESDFQWYLDLIKNNPNVHRAGAGIGLDRVVQWLTGAHSIKECVEFPRDAKTLIP